MHHGGVGGSKQGWKPRAQACAGRGRGRPGRPRGSPGMKERSRPLLQTLGYTDTSSTHMGIRGGLTHSGAAMVPASVPAPAPAPVPIPAPGRQSHCLTQNRASCHAGLNRGRAVGLQPRRGHRQSSAVALQTGSPGREKPGWKPISLVICSVSTALGSFSQGVLRLPMSRMEMRAGGTRMPEHAPVLAPGSHHPSHLSRHARLPAPQGLVGPCTCVCGPGPSPWHRDDGFLQQQDLLTLMMTQGWGTRGSLVWPRIGTASPHCPWPCCLLGHPWLRRFCPTLALLSPAQARAAQPLAAAGTQRAGMSPKATGQ